MQCYLLGSPAINSAPTYKSPLPPHPPLCMRCAGVAEHQRRRRLGGGAAQAIMRIPNPRKPRLPGTKITVAASPDEMQLLLNFGILKGIVAGNISDVVQPGT